MFYSCSTIQVVTDRNPKTDLSEAVSYEIRAIEEKDGFVNINDINKRRIEEGLKTELERKGMSSSVEPDIYVDYALAIDVKRYYNSQSTYHGSPYWGRRGGFYGPSFGTTTITEQEVKKGNLVVEVRDARTGEMVWYGVGSKTLSENRRKTEENIQNAIQKIMEEFPINRVIDQEVEDKSIREVS